MLARLEALMPPSVYEVEQKLATDLRHRRIERSLTRKVLAERSGVAISNIARFEQTGLISLRNFILLALTLDYVSEVRDILDKPKYATMDELLQIKRNTNKKKAYTPRHEKD